ncbi:tetratricopeptide repeat protein [Rheinheimera sp. NSM]|uniref:tetratricopeptide repeat protein n=1 Tax=Rheinheimera sp. NSM TaxID=3457884 RepID=UPI00403687E4
MKLLPASAKTLSVVTILLTLLLSGAAKAELSALEQLFEQQQYDTFLQQAQLQASENNAEALFLLGKAYDLGRGVTANPGTASQYYQQARALGSARASHNLGNMALHNGRKAEAISLLEEALAGGLKLPTLYNLGLAHSPADPTSIFNLAPTIEAAQLAGSYFGQAYELETDSLFLDKASREYLRAYLIALQTYGSEREQFDMAQLRQQAVQWLERGMAADQGTAWTNYGALLLNEKDYNGAKAAFLQGAQRNIAVANYHLATMADKGLGGQVDKKQALAYYEEAALAGMEQAKVPAYRLLKDQLKYEDDILVLEQGIARFEALKQQEKYPPVSLDVAIRRLAWGKFLAQQRQQKIALPASSEAQLALEACGLDLGQQHGAKYNLGINSRWRLAAYLTLADRTPLPFEGRVDAQGCARFTIAITEQLQSLLQQGAVFGLRFPNYTLPLALSRQGNMLQLSLLPVGTPLPAN